MRLPFVPPQRRPSRLRYYSCLVIYQLSVIPILLDTVLTVLVSLVSWSVWSVWSVGQFGQFGQFGHFG